jgi:hypothetical protein
MTTEIITDLSESILRVQEVYEFSARVTSAEARAAIIAFLEKRRPDLLHKTSWPTRDA